jgi:TP901 family phage tail tape measure protein
MATSAGTIPINATFNGAQLEKDVLSALNRIQSKSTLNLNTRNFTQPLGKITGLANEFNKSLEASNARVVAFGASAGVIFAVQKSFTALVASTIEVEKALTDINVVLNTSSKGIKQFGDQLFNVAKTTGSSFKDVASAATEFSRQGLGLEETLKRTRDALILTRLSGLDVVSSTEALTAAVNSFTKEALTTTDVVNKLAAVDAKFAVSSRDLSEALQRVGSSASEAGVSFDELLGIVTSVQQTTARGGAVIGNALKTIFTRIERPQVISDLRDFGIAVTDISGNTLPTIKVIENLAQSFQNLNPVVKSQVAELVGGVYQINILKAALADVSKQNSSFAEATRASSQAADEAIIKNKALNESLSALINTTTVNFTQFATKIGEVSVAPGIRKILGLVNDGLESYNEKDSEGVGEKIATGLLKGITDFVTGPGLGLGALAVGKLIGNFATFAGDATRNILGLNTLGRQQAVVQGEISKILSNNPQLIQQIIAGTKSRLQVEKEIKQILIEQAAISEKIKTSSADIGARFLASGLGVSTSGAITGRRSAGGYIPAKQQAAEMVGAMQGGYAPGKVVAAPKSIGGVMNSAETVKYVPGFAQPYILPPQGSSAARNLTSKSMSKNGINPYQAKGFVPNFEPRSLDNNGRYADSDYWYGSGLRASVPLSQIQTGTAASWSPDKGFFRTDGKNFTANDLNTFIRRGASYGDIRRYLPDSFLQNDPRFKAGVSVDQLRREYKPGAKIATTETVKEEAKRIFEPYTPPASMLIWDLAGKNNNQDEIVDLEKLTGEKKQAGRSYKIKIRALSGNALNEERFGLIDRTSKFARDITKKLASGIPGAKSDYSDAEVDDYFNKTGKNYNVLAGTIFEAGTNLAASYVRDRAFRGSMGRSGSGGDFDIMGGSNLSNVQKFFPGFTDSYGDYKLSNSYDSMREFIAKVEKEFPVEISNHFAKQESKIAGIKTSAKGFIPNFAPEQLSFDLSASNQLTASRPTGPMPVPVDEPITIGERSGSSLFIKPDGTLKVSFLRSSEGNPLFSIIKGLKKGLIKKIDAGAIIGPRVPNLITGLKNVLPELRKNSPLIPASIPIKGTFNPKALSESLFKERGEMASFFDDDSLGELNKYLNQQGYGVKREGQKDYSIFSLKDKVKTSFLSDDGKVYIPRDFSSSSYIINELKKIPELNLKLKKKRETGSSNYNREDFSKLRKSFEEMGLLGTSPEGKSVWQNLEDYGYGTYARLEDIYPNGLSKGFIPSFNPVKEAMGREMAAGYSSSQVRLGQSSKLKTSFNPMGLGVYNSTEGSLNNGIGLAEKAGINPKTKGMSAKGHIPNFAEFGGLDLFAVTSSLAALAFSARDFNTTLKELKNGTKQVIDDNTKSAASAANAIKKANEDLDKILKDQKAAAKKQNAAVAAEIKKTFSNINPTTLKTIGGKGAVPMSLGGGILAAANTAQIQRLEELRKEKQENKKKRDEEAVKATAERDRIREESLKAQKEAGENIKAAQAGKLGATLSRLGPSFGIIGSTLANVGAQFVPAEDKKTQAGLSGVGDVLSLAGTGAAFGPVGAAVGGVLGLGVVIKKIADADAEQAIDKINKSLDITKEKASAFSGAAQNYATSLESLQNALNDPKAQPQALLKFQTAITDSLSSIPEEFRSKVLAAGTDITKVSEAIAKVNKEFAISQENLERQLAITKLVNSKTGIFSGNTLNKADQDQFTRLFTQSINPEKILSNFKGGAGEFEAFINQLKPLGIKQESYNIPGNQMGAATTYTASVVNKEALAGIRSQLEAKGIFGAEIADAFEKTSKDINPKNLIALFDAIEKFGKGVFSAREAGQNLVEIQKQNVETSRKSAQVLKDLNQKYETLNINLSNQIEAEKNRAATLRDLKKIEAEGAVQLGTARAKGALNLASPFMTERSKFEAESNLENIAIQNRINAENRSVLDKTLSSFTDTITKKADEIRSKAAPSITDSSKTETEITKELNVFSTNIQKISPLISKSLQDISAGGDTETIKNALVKSITDSGIFKKPEADLIAGELQNTFEGMLNELIKITQQGDYDRAIQKVSADYQKRSLALSEKLSLAGGAAALGSTGQVGVSEMFDKLTELTSLLGKNVRSGNDIEKGSGVFRLLDTLSNQFNIRGAGVGSELAPLQNISIRARAAQLQKEGARGRELTNIALIEQTGRGIEEGGALDKAFNKLSEDSLSIAIDQITSQLKLENMGTYFDLLAQESQYLNELTKQQTEILAKQAPDITKTFTDVTTTQVGAKLESLNINLVAALKEINATQNRIELNKDIQNLLPVSSVANRESALKEIKDNLDRYNSFKSFNISGEKSLEERLLTGNPSDDSPLETVADDLLKIASNFKIPVANLVLLFNKLNQSFPGGNSGAFNASASSTVASNQSSYKSFGFGVLPTGVAPIAKPQPLIEAEKALAETQRKIQEAKNAKIAEINKVYSEGNQALADQLYLEMQINDRRNEITQRLAANQRELDILYNSEYGDTFFKEEKAAKMNARIEDNARLGKVDIGGITEKNTTYNRADFARDTGQLIDTFQTDFKSGIAGAFGEAIKGTKTLKDAFRDMFQGILNRMLDKSLEMGVDALFAFGKAATGLKNGGEIKKYNSGGMVTGGSGMKDDVPAMMSGGEYVIKKSSVNKYGANYLRALNGGLVPKYATGGFSIGPLQNEFLYNDPERPTSGEYAVDSRLSAMALTDENNPQNRIREDRFNKLDQYLQDRDQFERDKKQALKNYRNQVNSTFYSGVTAAAVQLGAAGLTMGAQKLNAKPKFSNIPGAGLEPGGAGFSQDQLNAQYARYGRANGGYIPKFAGGGYTGKDNIPALLMGGEYVMNKKAVDMYGRDFMGQLNSGSLPKYASGGMVGTSYTGQNTPQGSVEELVTALNTLNENLSKDTGITQSESGKISAAGVTQESGMSVVNNISINMTQGGEVTSEANASTQQGKDTNQNNIQNNAKLAELLRSKVVEVLVEQKRPGGLLYASR